MTGSHSSEQDLAQLEAPGRCKGDRQADPYADREPPKRRAYEALDRATEPSHPGHHGPEQILALAEDVVEDGGEMQDHQGLDQPEGQLMPLGDLAGEVEVDAVGKRATLEAVLVDRKQAEPHLQGHQTQEGDDGQGAQRIVACTLGGVPLAAGVKIGPDR